jgi:molybdate transport system ATP-binding protein
MSLEIILENVRVSRGGGPILDGVSWRLPPGGRAALIGGNGAGKSTLLRLARGEIWPDQLPGGHLDGERLYLVDGRATSSPIEARTRIGLAGADLRDLYRRRGWNVSGWLVVVSGLNDSPLPSGQVGEKERAAALETLEDLGLSDLAYRPFLELSQGQAQAVLLARAMVRSPEWLFLDEATDGLDAHARRLLHRVLDRLAGRGVGLAAATHQPSSLPDLHFETLVLDAGRVVFEGPLPEAAKRFAHAGRTVKRASKAASGSGERLGAAASPQAARSTPSGPSADGSISSPPPVSSSPLVMVRDACVVLSGREALRGLTWSLSPGENWVVVGRNGAGKSTFLKLLAGDLYLAAGSITRFDLVEPVSLWDLRGRMGLVSWEWQAEYPPDSTVRDVLVSGFYGSFGLYEEPAPAMLEAAALWLDRLGLSALADRKISTLSQGQARKAMIGRALAFDPQVLLLDEPLGGLDPHARAEMLSLLDDLALAGKQLVMVTHGLDEIPACVTNALVLQDGRALTQGPLGCALAAYTT